MLEGEEIEWSQRRFEDFLAADGQFVLSSDNPRTQLVKKVCDRLMAVLDLDTPVSAVVCPRNHNQIKEQIRKVEVQIGVLPSETAGSCLMPWKPLSNNPEKILQGHDWDLFVIDSPQINAFALPTKEIVIYTGLLNLLGQKEDLTAAIISHEISHVLERHAVENMGFSALSAVLFDAVRGISFALTISFPLLSDTLATCINYLSDLVAEKAYNKKLEFEADELGLRILTRAGYDPGAFLTLWILLSQFEQDQKNRSTKIMFDQIPWTRTHPCGKHREQHIQKHLPRFLERFQMQAHPVVSQLVPSRLSSGPSLHEKHILAECQ